jgi:cytochrome c oxidase subunit 2
MVVRGVELPIPGSASAELRVSPEIDDGEPRMAGSRLATRITRMSHTAVVITVAYVIAVVIGVVIAIAIWLSTQRRDGETEDAGRFARRETTWLVVVVLALFALLMATIFYVPYGDTAGPGKQVVRVSGVQFAWAIEPNTVQAGVPVEFLATTPDVNHGFGVYLNGVLQFQVQVIPGKTQKVVHTFSKPGTYEVLCLEFCGAQHHLMTSTFEVTPA